MDIKELQLLRDLSHDNIVRFFGVSVPDNTKETPVVMISELCTNGDLFDYIRNENAPSLSRVVCAEALAVLTGSDAIDRCG